MVSLNVSPELAAAAESFWARVERGPGCWEWQGCKKAPPPKHYGNLVIAGRFWIAHRLAWTLTNGPIPDGLFVCHRCDNPPCCNPDHLWLGTNDENMADMKAKGRARTSDKRAWRNPAAKLTPEQVQVVRARCAQKESDAQIARDLRVATETVRRIRLGHRWGSLASPTEVQNG